MNLLQKNIANVIYGGMDGIISTFSIIVGTLGAKQNMGVAFILAVANLVADAFSMGVGSYESVIHEQYRLQAFGKGLVTFGSFILIGGIPILSFMGALGKKKSLEFTPLNIGILIGLTLIAFIIIGLVKANHEIIVGKTNNLGKKKSRSGKIRIVFTTVLRGCLAGLIAYLLAHQLAKYVEN